MNQHQHNLQRANQQINHYRDKISQGAYRQNFHFCPPVGWLNDPNGFIQYNGEYHLFYQFNPYAAQWGTMHWGHAKSSDLVTWEHLPVALAPSEFYDEDENGGCFSGTAIEKAGKLYLFYTGSVIRDGVVIQTQNIAYSEDGIHFEKYAHNPIVEVNYPGASPEFFRDPKVWEHAGKYHMLVGTQIDGKGNALYYTSTDLVNWEVVGPIMETTEDYGFMWECPDFFEIDGRGVLMISPMGMQQGNVTTLYFIGDMDYEKGYFIPEYQETIDYGCDFYAPQTIQTEDGRRLMIAWQNGWEWMPWWSEISFGPTAKENWCGAMSLPREITVQNNRLHFAPITELQEYEENQYVFKNIQVWKEPTLLTTEISESFVLKTKTNHINGYLELMILNEEGSGDCLKLQQNQLTYQGSNNPYAKVNRTFPISKEEILIYSDSSSLEIFGKESGKIFSINTFLKKGARTFILSSEEPNELAELSITELRI